MEGARELSNHKQEVLDKLLPVLQMTEHLRDLEGLEYRGDRELVYARFASGYQKIANVALDSDVAMIMDVIRQII